MALRLVNHQALWDKEDSPTIQTGMKRFGVFVTTCALLLASACSQSPSRLVDAGNRYHEKKKYQEASILYRKAIGKDKTFAEAYYREALNLLDQNNPVEAAKFLRRAVDLRPDNVDAEGKLADIYLTAYSVDQKKFKVLLPEIKDLTSKILQRNAKDVHGLRLKAFMYLTDKNLEKAVNTFEEANRIQPHSREVVGWLAQALTANNQFDEAEKLMKDMIAHDKTWGPAYDFLFMQYMQRKREPDAEAILKSHVDLDPKNAVGYVNYSNYLLHRSHYPEAEAVIRKVLNDKKSFPEGRQLVGDFYLRAGKLSQAVAEFREGIREDPKRDLGYQERIIAALSHEGVNDPAKQKESVELARQLAAKYPKDLTANEMYASLLLATGFRQDVQKSMGELKKLVEKNNSDPILHMALARGYLIQNDQGNALNESLEALRLRPSLTPARIIAAHVYQDRGQFGKALEQTEIVLNKEAKNPEARLVRGAALLGLKELDKAQPELESLVAEYPDNAESMFQLSNLYLAEKNLDKAQAGYEKLWQGMGAQKQPDIRGFLGLQNIKVMQGHGEQAVAALQDLVQKNPKVLQFRFTLANFETQVAAQLPPNDPKRGPMISDAADSYRQILKSNTNSAEVWVRLALLQQEMKQNDAALASLEQATRANPNNIQALLTRAMLLETMGRKDQARAAYNQVLGVNPDNYAALNNLAFMNANTGRDLDQAMTLAEHAKKLKPGDPDVSDTLGYVYLKKNLNNDALREFQFAVNTNPKNANFRLHLAMALLKSGDKSGAKREASSALQTATADQQQEIRTFMGQIS